MDEYVYMNIWQNGSGRGNPKYVNKDLPFCHKSLMLRHADLTSFHYNQMASICY